MDVSHLLTNDLPHPTRSHQPAPTSVAEAPHNHHYATRRSNASFTSVQESHDQDNITAAPLLQGHRLAGGPGDPPPKDVAFELIIDNATLYKARLPMRVQIFPHDSTESIITTVKNFHGLYDPSIQGVNFEDAHGRVIIARYENLANNSTVFVRVVYDQSQAYQSGNIPTHFSASPRRMHNFDDAPQLLPSAQPSQILQYGQPMSRSPSGTAYKRNTSPLAAPGVRGSSSQQSRAKLRGREPGVLCSFEEAHPDANTYSDSDGGAGSVSSSRKSRTENPARAEISAENILEGGRRKRAKFESSELPLFVPPQVPASYSISSISPQRRSTGIDNTSPFARPHRRNLSYTQPLPSPGSHGLVDGLYPNTPQNGSPFSMPAPARHDHRLRDRSNAQHLAGRSSNGYTRGAPGSGVLPTPDPTIASCISDEDVALQLMRLGDTSNISYGQTSASTLDETMSGQADVASSATSESEGESNDEQQTWLFLEDGKKVGRQAANHGSKSRLNQVHGVVPSSDSIEPDGDTADGDYNDDKIHNIGNNPAAKPKMTHKQLPKVRTDAIKKVSKSSKYKNLGQKKIKAAIPGAPKDTTSPTSGLSLSRKGSVTSTLNFQHHVGADEADLSTKPRCQRCRKSKKGCDRQRPCQRCKDAGIGIEGCISEDEGNGRKGRFGRHMGVLVKKDSVPSEQSMENTEQEAAGAILTGMSVNAEKSKKRKR